MATIFRMMACLLIFGKAVASSEMCEAGSTDCSAAPVLGSSVLQKSIQHHKDGIDFSPSLTSVCHAAVGMLMDKINEALSELPDPYERSIDKTTNDGRSLTFELMVGGLSSAYMTEECLETSGTLAEAATISASVNLNFGDPLQFDAMFSTAITDDDTKSLSFTVTDVHATATMQLTVAQDESTQITAASIADLESSFTLNCDHKACGKLNEKLKEASGDLISSRVGDAVNDAMASRMPVTLTL